MKKVSIIVPAYNEEESLPHFYEEMCKVIDSLSSEYDFEMLFINDGSKDNTLKILNQLRKKDPRVNYIDMSRNFGKEIGMLAGFDFVRGDCAITIDADLQEPPNVIPEMLRKWEEGYDDVFGKRRLREQSVFKKSTSKVFHEILRKLSDIEVDSDSGDFRLLDRKCIEALKTLRETQRYTKGMYSWIGFNKTYVEYDISKRVAGKTKWNFRKLLHLAVNGITSHSVMPLKLASLIGVVTSFAAFIYMIYIIIKAIIYGDPVAGFPTLMTVILFLGGFILLALGIIGEYLGRIFIETKRRPPYFVNSINGSNPMDYKTTNSYDK